MASLKEFSYNGENLQQNLLKFWCVAATFFCCCFFLLCTLYQPLAAMVFESLMGSAWAVIWLGGGFKHFLLSPCFAPIPGEMNDPIWRAYYIWVVQPPPRQFGTLQVSSCTVSLQILCIVLRCDVTILTSFLIFVVFFWGRSSTCRGAVCWGVWSCYRETLERALGLCLQPGSLPVRCRFGWGIFYIVHFYT